MPTTPTTIELDACTACPRGCGARSEHLSSILANLYVAMKRIHASLDRSDVLGAIRDVLENQIGAEELAIFERDGDGAPFSLSLYVAGSGAQALYARVLEEVLASHAVYVRSAASGDPPDAPAACIPLRVGERVTGIIMIYSLVCHKERLDPLDLELCDLLADHAGVALYASALHARSKAEGGGR
jgi:GAF domain-containing protein